MVDSLHPGHVHYVTFPAYVHCLSAPPHLGGELACQTRRMMFRYNLMAIVRMFIKLYGSVYKTVQCLLDIWYSLLCFSVSFLVKLFKAPFCVVADEEKQAIVIVIRGTMSFKVRLPLCINVYVYTCTCIRISRDGGKMCLYDHVCAIHVCDTFIHQVHVDTEPPVVVCVTYKITIYYMSEGAYGCTYMRMYLCMYDILCVWLSLVVSGCLDRSLCFNVAIGFSA